jgi:hypothetical protein
MPTINDVLARTQITGYSSTDKTAIEDSLKRIYAKSPTARNIMVLGLVFFCLFATCDSAMAKVFCEPWSLVDAENEQKTSLIFHGKIISTHNISFKKAIRDNNRHNGFAHDGHYLQKIMFEVIHVKQGSYDGKYIDIYSADSLLEIDSLISEYGEELIVKASKFNEFERPKIHQKDLNEYDLKFTKNIENSYWIPGDICQGYQFQKIQK